VCGVAVCWHRAGAGATTGGGAAAAVLASGPPSGTTRTQLNQINNGNEINLPSCIQDKKTHLLLLFYGLTDVTINSTI